MLGIKIHLKYRINKKQVSHLTELSNVFYCTKCDTIVTTDNKMMCLTSIKKKIKKEYVLKKLQIGSAVMHIKTFKFAL